MVLFRTLGSRPLAALPNSYSTSPRKFDEEEESDGLYEIPDRDVSKSRARGSTRRDADSTTAHTNGRVAHPSTGGPVVCLDSVDGTKDEKYDTISCDVDFSPDDLSTVSASDSPNGAEYYRVVDFDPKAVEPSYAVVDKQTKSTDESREVAARSPSVEEEASSTCDKKFEVLIRRTTISSNARNRNNSDKSVTSTEVTEVPIDILESPPLHDTPQKEAMAAGPEDSIPTPTELEGLYAKVNMKEKHDMEAKKALYATVDKKKSGEIKFYSNHGSSEAPAELEFGHYTRIKGMSCRIFSL